MGVTIARGLLFPSVDISHPHHLPYPDDALYVSELSLDLHLFNVSIMFLSKKRQLARALYVSSSRDFMSPLQQLAKSIQQNASCPRRLSTCRRNTRTKPMVDPGHVPTHSNKLQKRIPVYKALKVKKKTAPTLLPQTNIAHREDATGEAMERKAMRIPESQASLESVTRRAA